MLDGLPARVAEIVALALTPEDCNSASVYIARRVINRLVDWCLGRMFYIYAFIGVG